MKVNSRSINKPERTEKSTINHNDLLIDKIGDSTQIKAMNILCAHEFPVPYRMNMNPLEVADLVFSSHRFNGDSNVLRTIETNILYFFCYRIRISTFAVHANRINAVIANHLFFHDL